MSGHENERPTMCETLGQWRRGGAPKAAAVCRNVVRQLMTRTRTWSTLMVSMPGTDVAVVVRLLCWRVHDSRPRAYCWRRLFICTKPSSNESRRCDNWILVRVLVGQV